jgi:tetratricopeptide (TPR) repeat protein
MKRARILALALFVLATGSSLGCSNDEERIREHLGRAEAYHEEAKHPEAILEYRNVIQIDPNHAQAHFGLAQTYLASNELANAAWEFRETVRLDPNNPEARLRLAEFAGLAGALEEALAQVDAILAAETPEDAGPLRLSAQLLRARFLDLQNKPGEALAAYQKAVELSQEATEPLLLLADHYRRRGEREKAEPLYRKLVETNPGYFSYAALGGFLSRDRSRDAEAEEVYALAVESADEEQRDLALRILASFYYSRARFEDAEATLKQALEERPKDLELIYLMARFYLARGQKQKADEMVEMAIQARPGEVEPHLVRSRYLFQTGEREAALEALDLALEIDPENDQVRLERAERNVDLGIRKGPKERIRDARAVVERVLAKGTTSSEALGLKGKIDLLEGQTEEAIQTLRQAIDLRPDRAPLYFLLGSALFSQGNFWAARDELEHALELDLSMLEARIILARTYSALGKHRLAIEEGQSVLLHQPGDRQMRLLVAQSLASQHQLNEAIDQLDHIPEAQRDVRTLFTYGRLFAAKGDAAQARSFYRQAEAANPRHPEILYKLLQLDRREGRLAESVERIDEALEKEPDSAALVQLRGLAALMRGQTDEAESRFRRAIELNPSNPMSYTSLATLLQASGRGDEAIATYEKAIEQQPDLGLLNLILATLYEIRGNTEKAIAHYEEVIRKQPGLAIAKNDLANLLATKRRNLDRALQLAQEARAALPDSPQVADTMGWVLFRMGMASAAIGYLAEAAALSGDDPEAGIIRYHLARAYAANGERREAYQTIQRALADLELQASADGMAEPEWAKDMRKLQRSLGRSLVKPRG